MASSRIHRTLRALLGLAILIGFQMLGLGLHRIGIPLPGSILGLLLFTAALAVGLIRIEWVELAASFLVRHMMLLFIPLMAGLTQMTDELRRDGVALVASLVVSLLAVILTTGGLAHFLLRKPLADAPNSDAAQQEPRP